MVVRGYNLYRIKTKSQETQESKHTPLNHCLPTDTEINSETLVSEILNGSLVIEKYLDDSTHWYEYAIVAVENE